MAGARADILAGRSYVELFVKDSKFYRGLRNARNRLREFGADMQAIGRQLVVISAAMLIPLAMSAKTFASFDDEMRKVGARSRGTAAELAELRDIAKDLGATTSFTAGQVAALQAKIAQKGFDRSGIAQMTDDILNLARAAGEGGEGDTTVAADLVSGNLRAFRLEAEQVAYLSDLFAATVNNSNFSLEGLTSALSSAAPIANRYGISIRDTVNVLAQMTNVNIDAASAGTAFRNMLLKLSDEAGRSKFNASIKAMTGNTIDFVDSAGNLKPLPQLLFDIGDAVKGLGSAQQGQLLSNLFGLRAVVAGGVLSDARNSFGELNDILSDVGGTAKRTSDEMDAGLGGMFRIIMSGVEGVKIALGEALEGSLTDVGTAAQDLLGIARELVENNQEAVVTFAKWAVGIGVAGAALLAIGLTSSLASVAIGGFLAIVSMSTAAFGLLFLPVTAVRIALSALTAIVGVARAVFMSLAGVVAFVRTGFISWMAVLSIARLRLVVLAIAAAAYRVVVSTVAIATAAWAVVTSAAMLAINSYRLAIVATTAAQLLWRATTLSSLAVARVYIAVTTTARAGMIALRSAIVASSAVMGLLSAGYAAVTSSATLATIATQAFAAVGFVIAALTSPIAITAAAIAGLGYVAFRAAGGFEGLANIAQNVLGSVSRVTASMTTRASALFGELKGTAIATFQGIRDAISSGDLQLAGKIALTGLRLAFMQGMQAIATSVNGVWGETVATFATQVAGGDFAGAWSTAVLAMDAIWTKFTAGIVKGFISAGREVLRVWRATVDGVTNYILQQAAQGGVVGAAIEMSTGVNVKEEIARNEKMKAAQAKLKGRLEEARSEAEQGLAAATKTGDADAIARYTQDIDALNTSLSQLDANGAPDIFSQFDQQVNGGGGGQDFLAAAAQRVRDTLTAIGQQLSLTPEEIEAQIDGALDQLESGVLPTFTEAAETAGDALSDGVSDGVDAASEEIEQLQQDLAALQEEARESREAANAEPVSSGKPETNGANPPGSGGPGQAGRASTAGPAAVTFSAAGLIALGGSGGQLSDAARETRILARILKESEREQTKAQVEAARAIVTAIATLGLHHA